MHGREPVSAPTSLETVREWAVTAARAACDKQGEDTVVIGVGAALAITDAFVITSAANTRQIRTIAEEIEEKVKEAGGPAPLRIEGLDDARWVLMDYGDFVVHLLLEEARDFYALERLWGDGEIWTWDDRPERPPAAALASGE
jgi:ribosome-associated protein